MSLFNVMEISGSALTAQSVRLNTIASNLANAEVVASKPESAYRARHPVFSTLLNGAMSGFGRNGMGGVRVDRIVESKVEPGKEFSPAHPMADEEGYIYLSNVNTVDEMANMISASRSYQSSVEAMNTTKQLIMRTLNLGK
ncbi:flagellar basal body rod protein FlgC [Pseudohalioglobus lutimaris]|uniref:Flagellar basal-body rod protein FlgC n=1 Tax=Pseudohalioglobus lutimaris TaxID=1737061 RepID=A0A2N5X1P2_9GAMM|nr:flagellar basal body rod protein FlgC [Pseudohalioglobus lutimaris]PLW68414.1 flagellar basal body rod protein FlgC [Pseudohalioglobus lutimaris]